MAEEMAQQVSETEKGDKATEHQIATGEDDTVYPSGSKLFLSCWHCV